MSWALHCIYAVTGGIFIGFLTGLTLMLTAPCHWFGSTFEGACGYGAMLAALVLGIITALISVGMLLLWLHKRHIRTQAGIDENAIKSPRMEMAKMVFFIFSLIGALGLPSTLSDSLLSSFFNITLTLLFIAISAKLLLERELHPAIALLALIPLFGPLAVAAILYWPRKSSATS